MVAAFIWGPMKWRMMHGLAFLYDDAKERTDISTNDSVSVFYHYMTTMVSVLPCQECRHYCQELFRLNNKYFRDLLTDYGAQRLAFDLHNIVNQKLDRPEIESVELVMRRSRVWNNEFTIYGMFGFLFVMVLNYNNYFAEEGRKKSKVEKAYREFFEALADLLLFLDMESLAESMYTCMPFTSPTDLFNRLYQEYKLHGFTEEMDEIQLRYTA
jgi:hypothetical protein